MYEIRASYQRAYRDLAENAANAGLLRRDLRNKQHTEKRMMQTNVPPNTTILWPFRQEVMGYADAHRVIVCL